MYAPILRYKDIPFLTKLTFEIVASQSRLYTAPEESESLQNAAREDLARNLAPLINDDDEDDNALMDPNHVRLLYIPQLSIYAHHT